MHALVVYESMYGNTHVVADSIADGLREAYEVTVVPVAAATADLIAGADLLVTGAPTHLHGLSRAWTRQAARKAAAKPKSPLTLDPDAGSTGLRDWLSSLAGRHAQAVAFDTRLAGVPLLTGRASRGISRLLERHGYHLVAPPESFLVTRRDTLVDGESSRARRWGEALAAAAGLVPAV
jgi:hypothetical protein